MARRPVRVGRSTSAAPPRRRHVAQPAARESAERLLPCLFGASSFATWYAPNDPAGPPQGRIPERAAQRYSNEDGGRNERVTRRVLDRCRERDILCQAQAQHFP